MFVDSHCHLDHLKLPDHQHRLDQELTRARTAGVSGFLCIGIDYDRFDLLLDIESRHADVWITIGEHPLADNLAGQGDRLRHFAAHPRIVAVGETGLDYHYAPAQAEVQRRSFAQHLAIAAELNKPVVVHSREAHRDTIDLIRAHGGAAGGVLHCFTDSWHMAREALDLGFYISISGIVTFANASALRDVVKRVPLDRLLIETDSPWLAPVPYRGKPNTPVFLPRVAETVADLQGISVAELGRATSQNFFKLFSKISEINK